MSAQKAAEGIKQQGKNKRWKVQVQDGRTKCLSDTGKPFFNVDVREVITDPKKGR